jgi:hypothetical protein
VPGNNTDLALTGKRRDMSEGTVFLGKSTKREELYLKLANRHGLITGATGTGKTVTLQILAEGFSAAGVPVFAADIKGDLSGVSREGEPKDFLLKRAITASRPFRRSSGTCSASRATRSAPPFRKWGRC